MRVGRVAAAIVVCVGVAAGPSAHASTARPVCNLVTDPGGDVTPTAPDVNNSDYDIRSADVATDKRQLTAVIRLASLAPEDASSVEARDYEFDFTANGQRFGLLADLVTGGANFEATVYATDAAGGQEGTDLGAMSGVVDSARHEIRMTAPLQLFAPYASFKQTYVDHLYATSARAVGDDGTATPDGRVVVGSQSVATVVDEASSKARYIPGRPSCVRVGK